MLDNGNGDILSWSHFSKRSSGLEVWEVKSIEVRKGDVSGAEKRKCGDSRSDQRSGEQTNFNSKAHSCDRRAASRIAIVIAE